MEYTFAMIRPGAMRRHKVAHIFDQIKQSGLKIEYFEQKYLTKEFIEEHYSHLHDPSIPPDVFERTEKENLSGFVVGLIISGDDAVKRMRALIGPGNVKKAKEENPNYIRSLGDENNNPDNLIHASDSFENAVKEIERFFEVKVSKLDEVPLRSNRIKK